MFLRDGGNIKQIEKDLNISYPTVKKMLSDVINDLGFHNVNVKTSEKLTKSEVYAALKNKEITLEEAEKLLEEAEDD